MSQRSRTMRPFPGPWKHRASARSTCLITLVAMSLVFALIASSVILSTESETMTGYCWRSGWKIVLQFSIELDQLFPMSASASCSYQILQSLAPSFFFCWARVHHHLTISSDMAALLIEKGPVKSTPTKQLALQTIRDDGENPWWPYPVGKSPWPTAGLATLLCLFTWWLFAQKSLGTQLLLHTGLTSEAADSHKITRQYNLTVGARWTNLGEILTPLTQDTLD